MSEPPPNPRSPEPQLQPQRLFTRLCARRWDQGINPIETGILAPRDLNVESLRLQGVEFVGSGFSYNSWGLRNPQPSPSASSPAGSGLG